MAAMTMLFIAFRQTVDMPVMYLRPAALTRSANDREQCSIGQYGPSPAVLCIFHERPVRVLCLLSQGPDPRRGVWPGKPFEELGELVKPLRTACQPIFELG